MSLCVVLSKDGTMIAEQPRVIVARLGHARVRCWKGRGLLSLVVGRMELLSLLPSVTMAMPVHRCLFTSQVDGPTRRRRAHGAMGCI